MELRTIVGKNERECLTEQVNAKDIFTIFLTSIHAENRIIIPSVTASHTEQPQGRPIPLS